MGITDQHGSLDWPERPAMSPVGGFFLQVRPGKVRNFEVVIPWPDGGLAHFWRDNAPGRGTWHGPNRFGDGRYVGAALTESDFAALDSSDLNNLEVLATRDDGRVDHWFRENGGAFLWKFAGTIMDGAVGPPSITYTGALFRRGVLGVELESHHDSDFYAAVALRSGGFEFLRQRHDADGPKAWERIGGPSPDAKLGPGLLRDRQFVAASVALTTLNNPRLENGWKAMCEESGPFRERGDILVAVVSDEGALSVYARGGGGSVLSPQGWDDATSVDVETPLGHVLRPFRGRPCLIQGDFGLDEVDVPFERGHYGNLELVAPAKEGGVLHVFRDNGSNAKTQPLVEGWHTAPAIGTAIYDEVSLIQSDFGGGESGNLELVARRHDQRGFDFFFRDERFVWHGPMPVEGDLPLGTTKQKLSVADTVTALLTVNIDFSVPESDLRDFLGNPEFTPYPATAQVLLDMLRGKRLRKPVFIDVIVFNYETTPGVASPREANDLNRDLLATAIVEGFNNRHGESATALTQLLT